jgi:hypothetical protein
MGEREKEKRGVEIIGKISARINTKERSTKIGQRKKEEVKREDKFWNRELRRMAILTIEDPNK